MPVGDGHTANIHDKGMAGVNLPFSVNWEALHKTLIGQRVGARLLLATRTSPSSTIGSLDKWRNAQGGAGPIDTVLLVIDIVSRPPTFN